MQPLKILFAIALLVVLASCASYKPVPEGYTGPVATLQDGWNYEGNTKAVLYYVDMIDGNRVESGLTTTRRASYGTGFSVNPRGHRREVPVRKMKLRLVASHVVGAPIHELASRAAGTFFSVEGDIEFTPEAGVTYLVKGELKKNGSSVWLVDSATSAEIPGTKIVGK
jgi:hypothetical protein